MGMLTRGADEYIMTLNAPAAQAADLNLASDILPKGKWYLRKLFALLTVEGTTGNHDTDINDDGTSILGSTKIRFATGSKTATYPTLGQVAADGGSLISLDNDAVATGTPGEGQVVKMVWSRIPQNTVINEAPD